VSNCLNNLKILKIQA
jgi:hypothetical protein